MHRIWNFVITGGPCAGKTTALSWIQNMFTELGYHVIFIPECATELINAGISGRTCKDVESFQNALINDCIGHLLQWHLLCQKYILGI